MRAVAAFAGLVAVAAQVTPQPTSPVGTGPWTPSSLTGITFDVTNLASANNIWVWNDPTDSETTSSTYYFNIGYNLALANMPSSAFNLCNGKASGATAYQVTTAGGTPQCYALTTDISKPRSLVGRALVDQANPARGFSLTYPGGDTSNCFVNGQPVSRTFTLSFYCDRAMTFPAPNASTNTGFIDETNSCNYQAFTWSQAGCPLECPVVNGVVCGGNGVCGYDSTAGAARCFCNDNYIEADCQKPRTPFPSGAVAGATIGGIIAGAIGVFGYSFYAYRRPGAQRVQAADGFYGA